MIKISQKLTLDAIHFIFDIPVSTLTDTTFFSSQFFNIIPSIQKSVLYIVTQHYTNHYLFIYDKQITLLGPHISSEPEQQLLIKSIKLLLKEEITIQHCSEIQPHAINHTEGYRKKHFQKLVNRQHSELQFISAIKKGYKKQALKHYKLMHTDTSYLNHKHPLQTLTIEKYKSVVVRTICRMTALDIGVPVIISDAIAQQAARALIYATTSEEVLQITENMISDYCQSVSDNINSSLNSITQSTLYTFHHYYDKTFTINTLAEEIDISPNHLIKIFKSDMGTTPLQYLNNFRLEQAKILLKTSRSTVQEIADKVGIPDESYFIKLFKKKYQLTPLEYRKK